jgi:hypothetical protein
MQLCLAISHAISPHLLNLLSLLVVNSVGIRGSESAETLAKTTHLHQDSEHVLVAIEQIVRDAATRPASFGHVADFISRLMRVQVAPPIIERFSKPFATALDASPPEAIAASILPVLTFLCTFDLFQDVLERTVARCNRTLSLKSYSEISSWFISAAFPPCPLPSKTHIMKLLGNVTSNREFKSSSIIGRNTLGYILSIFLDFLSLKDPLLDKYVGARGGGGLTSLPDERFKMVSRYVLADAAVQKAISLGNPACNTLCHALITRLNVIQPVFTWRMSLARFMSPSIPVADLLEFLLGPEPGPFIVRGFSGIAHARDWISKHSCHGPDNGYSIRGEPSGVGRKSIVTISKTRKLYDSALQAYKEAQAELRILLALQAQAHLVSSIVHYSRRRLALAPRAPYSAPLPLLRIYPATSCRHPLPMLTRAQLSRLLCTCSLAQRILAALLRGNPPRSRIYSPRIVMTDRLASDAVVRWLHKKAMLGGGSADGHVNKKRKKEE